jgi:hypothetical protein
MRLSAEIDYMRWWIQNQTSDAVAILLGAGTLALGIVTLYIVIRQLRLMKAQTDLARAELHITEQQTALAQRQTEIMAAQDTLNREILARAARLRMFGRKEGGFTKIFCRNDGNRGARGFHWYLLFLVSCPSGS